MNRRVASFARAVPAVGRPVRQARSSAPRNPCLTADFRRPGRRGFTLIELLVAMSIIALLLSLAVPRYFTHVERTKEVVLRENLLRMRDALDKFYGDNGRYPNELNELVTRRYLRQIPPDPLTDSAATWVIVAPAEAGKGRVGDIRSGAAGKARDGTPYSSW